MESVFKRQNRSEYALVLRANFYVSVLCLCDKHQVVGLEEPQVSPAILKFLKIVT